MATAKLRKKLKNYIPEAEQFSFLRSVGETGSVADFLHLPPEHAAGYEGGNTVGDGECAPYAVEAEARGKDEEKRNHEDDLSGQR